MMNLFSLKRPRGGFSAAEAERCKGAPVTGLPQVEREEADFTLKEETR